MIEYSEMPLKRQLGLVYVGEINNKFLFCRMDIFEQ
jgi:hypothetical protein